MGITISITVLGIVTGFIGIEMVNTPPTKPWHKWAWRFGFIAIGLVIITLTWIQEYRHSVEAQAQQVQFGKQVDSIKIDLERDSQKRDDKIIETQTALKNEQQILADELATNQFISPELRQRIYESNNKFQELDSDVGNWREWRTKFREKQFSVQVEKEKEHSIQLQSFTDCFAKCSPVYDDIIRTFENLLKSVAASNDVVVSNYRGLPAIVDFDALKTEVAEIKFKTNADWDFTIFLTEKGIKHLIITSKSGYAGFSPDLGNAVFDSEVSISKSGVPPYSQLKPISDYKTNVEDALQYFIAAHADQFDPINKPTEK